MQIKTLVCLMAAMAMLPAAAQVLAAAPKPNTACIQFNQTIVTKLDSGQIAEAEALLSAELKEQDGHPEPSCLGLTLHNFANVLALSGRLAEAEAVAQRSLRLNAVTYAQEDSRLFRPLHLLWSIQFQRGERGKARQTFHKMQALLLDRAQDRSMFHGATATQLQADGRYEEAEREFLKALAAAEEEGRAQTVDFAILLSGLGTVQLVQRSYPEAGATLDRALAVANSAKDTVPTDLIKIFSTRGALRARQTKWQEAAEDFRSAILIADRQARMDPAELKILLGNFGFALRKAHRGKEAGSIEARGKAIRDVPLINAIVDLSELPRKANGAQAHGNQP